MTFLSTFMFKVFLVVERKKASTLQKIHASLSLVYSLVGCSHLAVDFKKAFEWPLRISNHFFYKFVFMLDFRFSLSTVVEYNMKSNVHLFNLQGAQLLTAAKGLSNLKVTHRRNSKWIWESEIIVPLLKWSRQERANLCHVHKSSIIRIK